MIKIWIIFSFCFILLWTQNMYGLLNNLIFRMFYHNSHLASYTLYLICNYQKSLFSVPLQFHSSDEVEIILWSIASSVSSFYHPHDIKTITSSVVGKSLKPASSVIGESYHKPWFSVVGRSFRIMYLRKSLDLNH